MRSKQHTHINKTQEKQLTDTHKDKVNTQPTRTHEKQRSDTHNKHIQIKWNTITHTMISNDHINRHSK